MLTKDLLVARRCRGKIRPRFVDPRSPEYRGLAGRVLRLFREHVGASRERLAHRLEELEDHRNFKLVRGLTQLLERRGLFEPVYRVEPKALRRRLFQGGYVTDPQRRQARLEGVARVLGCSPEEAAASFWADREEKQVLRGFLPSGPGRSAAPAEPEPEPEPEPVPAPAPESEPGLLPEELLRRYNLSLAQTLLFEATELWFQASGNYQEIFRWIKYLGLMYEAIEDEGRPGRVTVKVDGPASLFRETTRYGTSLAKLLPVLVRAETFQLRAQIKEGSRRYAFELDHSLRGLFPSPSQREGPDPERFDSAVEADFYRRIRGVMRDWQIKREPTIFKAGPHIFIPDFGFERRGVRYYLEVVGFWTPEYLEKKLSKLRATQADLLVAVDRKLNCTEEDLQATGKEFFVYEKRLPLEPVIQRLLALAEEQKRRELEWLQTQDLTCAFEGDLIRLEELARRYDVGVEAIREAVARHLEGGHIEGYHLVGGQVVSQRLLEGLKARLDALPETEDGGRDLAAVQDVLSAYGLEAQTQALERVGYKVDRKSLLEARVVRLPIPGSDSHPPPTPSRPSRSSP